MLETFYPPLETNALRAAALRRAIARLTTTKNTNQLLSSVNTPKKGREARCPKYHAKKIWQDKTTLLTSTEPPTTNCETPTRDIEPLPSEHDILQRLEELRQKKRMLSETYNQLTRASRHSISLKEKTRAALCTFKSMKTPWDAASSATASDEESVNSKSTASRFEGTITPATLSPCKNDQSDIHFEERQKRKFGREKTYQEHHHHPHHDTHQRRPTSRAPMFPSSLPYPHHKEQPLHPSKKLSTSNINNRNNTFRKILGEMHKTRPTYEDHHRFFVNHKRCSVSPQREVCTRSNAIFIPPRLPPIKRRRISHSPAPPPVYPYANNFHRPFPRRTESPSYDPRMRRASVHQEDYWKYPPPSRRSRRTPPFPTTNTYSTPPYDLHKPNANRPPAIIPSIPGASPSSSLLRSIENNQQRGTILNDERTIQRRRCFSVGGGYKCDKRRY